MTQNNRPVRRRPAAAGGEPARQARPQARRPAPAPRRAEPERSFRMPGGYFSGQLLLLLLVSAAAILLGIALQYAMPDGFVLRQNREYEVPAAQAISEIHSNGPLRLNEVMTSNGGIIVDASGKTPDWVEVANVSDAPLNLEGYILARSAKARNVFSFPDITLEAGECLLVYADGDLRTIPGEELHAPFRLSSGGDALMLFNRAEVAVDTVNLPALGTNVAFVRRDRDHWEADEKATPGVANTAENYAMMHTVRGGSSVVMTEIVASNTRFRPDPSGTYLDYVILRNTSGEAVDLSGWYLSDNKSVPRKWRFPDGVSIAAGGGVVVYCSGRDNSSSAAGLHTNFRLSTEGETITLSNAGGQPVDQVTYDLLRPDTAYLRGSDNSWSVGVPST